MTWKPLKQCPHKSMCRPHMVNQNTFIVVPKYNGQSIYTFDIIQNEWRKIITIGVNFCAYSSVYNHHKHLLYVCMIGYPCKLFIIDLQSKLSQQIIAYPSQFALFCIENEVHQIFHFSGIHQICYSNGKLKKQRKYNCFSAYFNVNVDAIIHLQKQSRILLFGGYDAHKGGCQKRMYNFSLEKNCKGFTKMNVEMPVACDAFGLTTTKNEKYIILIGGRTHHECVVWPAVPEWTVIDDIFIFNTQKNSFFKSAIKTPKKGCFQATMINDLNDEFLGFGFITQCYKHKSFTNVNKLPYCLIQIICCYFCNEKIYLLHIGTGLHWTINVDKVLKST